MELEKRTALLEAALSTWRIRLGAPLLDRQAAKTHNFYQIDVPSDPHVFYARRVRFLENESPLTELPGMMVLLGHAIVTGEALEDWKFLTTGKSVVETVEAYEKVAESFGAPPLDVVLACRNTTQVQTTSPVHVFTSRDYPYIVPTAQNVTLREMADAWVDRGQGVRQIIADAGEWYGIQRWINYWNTQNSRERYQIPAWATNPRM